MPKIQTQPFRKVKMRPAKTRTNSNQKFLGGPIRTTTLIL